jgi:DNA-binding transcriptional MocR family regulator
VASGGTLAAAAAAAAIAGGVGATIGSALALWVEQHHADYLQDQLDHGGLLLWVRTRDQAREERAVDILRRHAGEDVHVHDMPIESYTSKRPAASDLEKALLDPNLVFARPKDVIARSDFTRDQQRAVLQRWVYDARELEVAEGEGMVGGEPDLMDQVKAALRQLDESTAKISSA